MYPQYRKILLVRNTPANSLGSCYICITYTLWMLCQGRVSLYTEDCVPPSLHPYICVVYGWMVYRIFPSYYSCYSRIFQVVEHWSTIVVIIFSIQKNHCIQYNIGFIRYKSFGKHNNKNIYFVLHFMLCVQRFLLCFFFFFFCYFFFILILLYFYEHFPSFERKLFFLLNVQDERQNLHYRV